MDAMKIDEFVPLVFDEFRKAYADVLYCEIEGNQPIETDREYQEAMKQRNLHWKAPHFLTLGDAIRIVTFDYNQNGERDALVFLAGHILSRRIIVELAREYSFCFYITVTDGHYGGLSEVETEAFVGELKANLTADEIDLQEDGSIRCWWD